MAKGHVLYDTDLIHEGFTPMTKHLHLLIASLGIRISMYESWEDTNIQNTLNNIDT